MIKDAELLAIYGRRGSGKSTLTKQLLRGRPKVVVFDPRREYGGSGKMVTCRTPREVYAAALARWRQGFQIAYEPEPGNEARDLHNLVCPDNWHQMPCLWKLQEPYDRGRDTRKLTLVVEEMDLSLPVHALPADMRGMYRVCNQGRHFGIECIGVTQRPNQIAKVYRGNCAVEYIFPLADRTDQVAILQKIGNEHAEALRTLKPHHYLRYENGTVTTAKTVKPTK
ncbi:hypothetical protein [Oceanibaculum indicum]|uniref:Helicase HerA central domain-containing protein n=1 Tax=Oceanibaculum indicum TaxID=526216 RepID=A0A420WQG5_9PROT|nr:hypothetical protein [Oceanibaculum indicum]RKQ73102.1 hypothetical protein BCL74_0875 [Oceanibaculum indicum]